MSGAKERKRSTNWDDEEKHLLRELVREKINILENKCVNKNNNQEKKEAWEYVTNRFNLVNKRIRTNTEITSQWRNIKTHAKKIECEFRKGINKTGGGPKPKTPPPDVLEIIEMIPNEFIVDSNKYDSDSIYKQKMESQGSSIQEIVFVDYPELPLATHNTENTDREAMVNLISRDHGYGQNTKKRQRVDTMNVDNDNVQEKENIHSEHNTNETMLSKNKNKRKLKRDDSLSVQKQLYSIMEKERMNRMQNENEEHKLKMEILLLKKELLFKKISEK